MVPREAEGETPLVYSITYCPPLYQSSKKIGGFSSENGSHFMAIYLSIVETCKLLKNSLLEFLGVFLA